jgi:hypothetical protein
MHAHVRHGIGADTREAYLRLDVSQAWRRGIHGRSTRRGAQYASHGKYLIAYGS